MQLDETTSNLKNEIEENKKWKQIEESDPVKVAEIISKHIAALKSNEVIETQGLGSVLLAKILTATQDQFTMMQSKLLQTEEILAEKQQQLSDIKDEMREIAEESLQSQTIITELEWKVKEAQSKLDKP